jgi:hypothetical protein
LLFFVPFVSSCDPGHPTMHAGSSRSHMKTRSTRRRKNSATGKSSARASKPSTRPKSRATQARLSSPIRPEAKFLLFFVPFVFSCDPRHSTMHAGSSRSHTKTRSTRRRKNSATGRSSAPASKACTRADRRLPLPLPSRTGYRRRIRDLQVTRSVRFRRPTPLSSAPCSYRE